MKIIFKHSTRCPISGAAKREVDSFLKENGMNFQYEMIDVIADKPRSAQIAETLGIQHESPQIIILDSQEFVIWHASHRAITVNSIKKAIQQG